jgi:adenosylmethionine-8-amino-7-oxononanoate aminotransferase
VSYGALSASGFADDKDGFGPLLDGFLQIPAPYEYRRAPGLDADEFQLAAARELESAILRENPAEVALFLAEPVLGFGGVIPPSKLYWQTVADVCKRYDVKLVLDEVTTGYGRTGTLFASEAYGIEPDVMALGKAMSAGYFPLGAVVASDEIYEAFLADDHGVRFNHGSTNGGHPGACAAGLKTLEIFASERTVELVSPRGEFLGRQLRGLLELPIVGDVRGAGLMFAIELVADKESKQPLHPAAMTKIVEACFNRGLWVHQGGNNIIMLPPFIMDESLLHEACQRFSKVLRSAMNWI